MIIHIMYNYIKNFVIKNSDNSLMLNLISRIFDKPKPPIQLGRWSQINDSKVNSRIDWSNEDHCGTCGSLKLQKKDISKK